MDPTSKHWSLEESRSSKVLDRDYRKKLRVGTGRFTIQGNINQSRVLKMQNAARGLRGRKHVGMFTSAVAKVKNHRGRNVRSEGQPGDRNPRGE